MRASTRRLRSLEARAGIGVALLLTLLSLGSLAGCASGVGSSPRARAGASEGEPEARSASRAAAPDEPALVTLVLRGLRTPAGKIQGPLLAKALDEGLLTLFPDAPFPLDAWAGLAPEDGAPLVAGADDSPVVEQALARLASARGRSAERVALGDDAPVALVVLSPRWPPSKRAARLRGEEGAREREAALFVVDLVETRVNGAPWGADMVFLSNRESVALAAAHQALSARAEGRVPPFAEVAELYGVDPETLLWARFAAP